MKNRLKAILLATGLTASMMFTCAYADEASTEAVTEAATEAAAVTEEAAETEAAAETEEAAQDSSELASEAAEEGEAAAEAAAGGVYAAYYDNLKAGVVQTLTTLSSMTGDTLQQAIDTSTDASQKAMLATWQSMEEELGSFVSAQSQEVTEDGSELTITTIATYENVGETPVEVVYKIDAVTGESSIRWDVDYPMSKLLQQAGMNTVMGVGIVFLVLLFLSFLISQIHWIPDLIGKKEKEKKAAEAAAPVQAAVPVAVEEQEELTDDLELVAVISAAIAASENTSTDGFVVRSIKKANRRKWQNA